MPVHKVKVEYSEKELKELLAKEHGLDVETSRISILKNAADYNQGTYTTITIEGQKK